MNKLEIKENNEFLKEINQFFSNALKEIMSILNADCGSFFLFDPEKKELTLDSYFNRNSIDVKNIKRRVGEGVLGKIVETKAPVLVRDVDMDSRFGRNGYRYHSKSFISIPLFISDKLIGIISITDKATREAFSEKDLQFAVTLCKYGCTAIENLFSSKAKPSKEEPLENRKRALLEKYASVGKLAAGVVHEINNPLDGVIRYTNISLSQIKEQPAIQEYLMEIKKGLNRICAITKSLLEFSHIVNSSDFPKLKKYVNVHEMIDESLDVLKESLKSDIQIVKKYKANVTHMLDMGIFHILINIIKNAIDAMPEGGTLEISTENKDSVFYISFKDTGIGIPVEIKERIFEPFFTTKNIGKGTGLGLAICKEILNEYEGKIEVQSHQNEGSIFTILIPEKYLKNV